jgi:hypothetical protein
MIVLPRPLENEGSKVRRWQLRKLGITLVPGLYRNLVRFRAVRHSRRNPYEYWRFAMFCNSARRRAKGQKRTHGPSAALGKHRSGCIQVMLRAAMSRDENIMLLAVSY